MTTDTGGAVGVVTTVDPVTLVSDAVSEVLVSVGFVCVFSGPVLAGVVSTDPVFVLLPGVVMACTLDVLENARVLEETLVIVLEAVAQSNPMLWNPTLQDDLPPADPDWPVG